MSKLYTTWWSACFWITLTTINIIFMVGNLLTGVFWLAGINLFAVMCCGYTMISNILWLIEREK